MIYFPDVLWLPESVCFNLDKQGAEFRKENFPHEIQAKWRQSDESFIARISDYNRQNFRANPITIIADASHHTNKHNWYVFWSIFYSYFPYLKHFASSSHSIFRQLLTCHSYNARQEGRVVLSIISPTESFHGYLHGFRETLHMTFTFVYSFKDPQRLINNDFKYCLAQNVCHMWIGS